MNENEIIFFWGKRPKFRFFFSSSFIQVSDDRGTTTTKQRRLQPTTEKSIIWEHYFGIDFMSVIMIKVKYSVVANKILKEWIWFELISKIETKRQWKCLPFSYDNLGKCYGQF